MTDDAELLLRYARDRSEAAFAEIVRRHLSGVYSAALRRVGGDVHLAQDVAQKVFIALARKAEALARHPFLTSWLYTATRHEAANLVRGEQRRKVREQEVPAMHGNEPAAAEHADWSKVSPVLDEAIDKLSEEDRKVILMRFIDQRSFSEIGAVLKVSEDAARMRNERALERIRSRLQQGGISSTSTALGVALAENAMGSVPHGVESIITGAALASGPAPIAAAGIGTALAGVLLSPTISALLVTIAALTAAGYELHQEQLAAAELVSKQNQYQALQESLHANERSLSAATNRVQQLQAASKGASLGRSAEAAPDSRTAGIAFMKRHPEVKTALNEYEDATNHARYWALYQTMGLTPDQIKQFEALIRGSGFGRILESGGTVDLPTDDTVSPDERQSELRALLGDSGYEQYLKFSGSLGGRSVATNLASLSIADGDPLTPDQARQVADIFSSTANPKYSWQYGWDAALAKTGAILNADQTEALQRLRVKDENEQQANALVR